jgi:ubiquinone/menaquinone biosynthesis C-methylase UbiE
MDEVNTGLFNFVSVPQSYREFLQPAVFDPWAQELLGFVPPARGSVILDVAAGTGAVAHAAAQVAGPSGRVIASDVSPLMLADTGSAQTADRAPVEVLVGPAEQLSLPEASVDVAYCQQGLQFMPDRRAVMAELHRVLRPGGVVGVAVWAEGTRPEPFDTYARILRAHGVAEPYPDAYDTPVVTMSEQAIGDLLNDAGFAEITVHTVTLSLTWPEPQAAASGLLGSSYGPTVASLEPAQQDALFSALVREVSRNQPEVTMTAVLGRGTAG